ncbi:MULTISPECIES: hypothetical protein [Microcystis]|jgi:ribosomal protein RSM22 (predicted rRNA methylase)|uniref:Uncharacterized protein n=3 Tax=Microcystis TaxID=1125 RepID=A0A5J4F743_MICAE|nr:MULTISPECIES: hypothetical protein [Microcystis]OCY13538.1 MAG: hypothetical protein BEV12_23005 [Microcystis aeruginosa CACIAM 03]TRU11092.1 MAG: hypothetical protein EWV59_10925 [Microcystis aeruginosa Ma_MB_F_20061100_S19D]TRU17762.1 MAG: hypothetical protein EWV58_03895 [Microcystis aeruginosa Ma_MB_F_20061100_S19]EPF19830.1 hypothetical protein MAESPC_03581 [Microcystis aeruginosa SPC777]MBD2602867.1 hypothetical protein [Microcystis viridis FACHB-1342]
MNQKLIDSLVTIVQSLSDEERQSFEQKLFFDDHQVSTQEIMNLVQTIHSFDFLKDEPDIYTLEDGESIK